jgi:hypothetical protein
VASSFAVGSSRLGEAVRAAAARAEVPGFFALAAETPTLRATCYHPEVVERSRAPCAHRLGEPTKRQCRGRVMSLRGAVRQSPKLPILAPEPGSRFPARVFSAHRYRDPTRLPRIQSTAGGPAAEARSRHQLFEGRRNRGLTPAFRPSRAVAPLREENDGEPRSGPFAFLSLGDVLLVGPHGFPWTHRRGASNPLLQPTFRSRAPAAKTPSSETARRAPWENPPAFRFEILFERRVAAAIRGGRRTTSRSSGLQRLRA